METGKNSLLFSSFALLASSVTFVCCALPIILVSLGLGSVMEAINVALPYLGIISQYKIWVFLFSGVLLLTSAWKLYSIRNLCPTDPNLAASCQRVKAWSKWLLILAILLWVVSLIAAYFALPIIIMLGF